MANIAEISNFDAVVHELATADPIEGGPGGVANAQAQALANRTKWLKDNATGLQVQIDDANLAIDNLETDLDIEILNRASADTALQALITEINRFIPKNRGKITGYNIGTPAIGAALSVSGQISAANVFGRPGGGDLIRCTMANSMSNINYKVVATVQSTGTIEDDNSFNSFVFRPVTATTFEFYIEEIGAFSQNLTLHFDIISLT